MLAACELAVARGALDPPRPRRTARSDHPDGTAARRSPTSRRAEAVEAAGRDKKIVGGKLHFVLPTAIGTTTTVTDVTTEELYARPKRSA